LKYLKSRSWHSIFIASFCFVLIACETESTQQVFLNTSFLSLKPTNKYSKSFANASGDTVLVELSENNRGNLSLNGNSGIGSISEGSQIVVETREYILSCNSPQFDLNYFFDAASSNLDERGFVDRLVLSLSDESSRLAEGISLIYRNDSVLLWGAANYYDTLALVTDTFTDVLSPQVTDANENRNFYFNLDRGLLGFRTTDGELYELVN